MRLWFAFKAALFPLLSFSAAFAASVWHCLWTREGHHGIAGVSHVVFGVQCLLSKALVVAVVVWVVANHGSQGGREHPHRTLTWLQQVRTEEPSQVQLLAEIRGFY